MNVIVLEAFTLQKSKWLLNASRDDYARLDTIGRISIAPVNVPLLPRELGPQTCFSCKGTVSFVLSLLKHNGQFNWTFPLRKAGLPTRIV